LFIFNLNPLYKNKNKNIWNEKIKYFNFLSFRKTTFQQNILSHKKTINNKTFKLRNFLRYVNKNLLVKNSKLSSNNLKKKLITLKKVNYNSLRTVSKKTLVQNFQLLNVFVQKSYLKNFSTKFNLSLNHYLGGVYYDKHQFLLTTYNLLSVNSFQVARLGTQATLLPKFTVSPSNSLQVYWFTTQAFIKTAPLSNSPLSYKQLSLALHFSYQTKYFKFNQSVPTRFFPKGVMEFWSKNFYILNRNTISYSLKGGLLTRKTFLNQKSLILSSLNSLLFNTNTLENTTFKKKNVLNYCPTGLNKRFAQFLSGNKAKTMNSKRKQKLLTLSSSTLSSVRPIGTTKLLNKALRVTKLSNLTDLSNTSQELFFNNTKLLTYTFGNSLLFKYLYTLPYNASKINSSALLMNLNNTLFSTTGSLFTKSNVVTFHTFEYNLRRRVLKAFTYDTFSPNVTMWYYHTIIRFIENCTGKKAFLKFNPFIENSLTFNDLSRCYIWARRVVRFQRVLGPRLFLRESLKIINVAIRYRDPTFLANWIRAMLKKTNFYKYKPLFRYLKYVFTHLFQGYFQELGFKGIKLKLKGKICVAGNARTRTLFYRIGVTTHSTFDNRVVYDLSYVNTFTGVLGFQLWFYY